MSKDDLSRRQFFRFLPDRLKEAAKNSERLAHEKKRKVTVITRPPGAIVPEDMFSAICQQCQQCANACPDEVILFLSVAFGQDEGTPHIDLTNDYCRWCEDTPCISACESGALSKMLHEPIAPIAKVKLDFDKCLVSQGTICDACRNVCPLGIDAIKFNRMAPSLDESACVGCGKCIYHCVAEPVAFSIIKSKD